MTLQNKRTALRRLRKDSAQGMTEYIIIVAFIAIAAIGIITVFGNNIRQLFGGATQAMNGNTGYTAATVSGAGQIGKQVNLKNFASQNQPN